MADTNPDAEFGLDVGPGSGPGEYTVKVVSAASGGKPQSTFTLDLAALEDLSRTLESTVLASAARARGRVVPELEKPLREMGSRLFQVLFAGPIGTTYRSSLAVARERGERLRIVLSITAPELAVMPWEALYDDESGVYVCRTEPLVRHIDAPYPEPLPVRPPLRILGIVSAPRDLQELDVDAEREHLEHALARPIAARQVHLHWLTTASWSNVHEQLLQHQWHVLHFIGHGDFDPERGEGRIALVRDDGRTDWVDATSLADLLGEAEPTPRVVVLNSCASGQNGSHDLFSGTAATLVHRGISAVVAMQFSVSDTAAVAFPRGFYAALAGGRRVDEAVRSGRIEILGTGRGTLEWVTPILHVRGQATELFEVVGSPPEPESPVAPDPPRLSLLADPHWADALAAYFAERWPEAVERFEGLQARYPDEARVEGRLQEARRKRDVEAYWTTATSAAEQGDWDTAVAALERLTAIDPAYPDAASRLERARAAQRRRSLVDEMTVLHQAGQWDAVVAAAQELARLDPQNADPNGIVSDARAKIRDTWLADRYAQGLNHLDREEWRQAVAAFAAVEQERPGYRDAAAMRAAAQRRLEPQHRPPAPPPPPPAGAPQPVHPTGYPPPQHPQPVAFYRRQPPAGGPRRRSRGAVVAVTIAAVVTVVLVIAGIVSTFSDGEKPSPPRDGPTSGASAAATPKPASGLAYTIVDYIRDNGIVETPIHRGDPGAPTVTLPSPPGWVDAGEHTPQWAYSAIVYNDPAMAADPPMIVALMSKLVGNVDPAKILQFAPGEVKNLPGYAGGGPGEPSTLDGFDAFQLGGTYTKDGVKRAIGQKTVVIPGQDGLYVLQLNADSREDHVELLMNATAVIDEQTTIAR